MMAFGMMWSFATPAVLIALLGLPVVWWLLRVTPPPARRQSFPPLRLLLDLASVNATAARTPPWLVALRLLIASLLIIGLAGPQGERGNTSHATTSGSLLLVMDTGWDAAADWPGRREAALTVLDAAARVDRPVRLLVTAMAADLQPLRLSPLLTAEAAKAKVLALVPQAWPDDLIAATKAVQGETGEVVWITGLLDRPDIDSFITALRAVGAVTILTPPAGREAVVISDLNGDKHTVTLRRVAPADAAPARTLDIRAVDSEGVGMATQSVSFPAGAASVSLDLALPGDLARRVARLEAVDPALGRVVDAAAVWLRDAPWSHRTVAIAASDEQDSGLPLLSSAWYVERALTPLAEVGLGTVDHELAKNPSLLILTDGVVPPVSRDKIADWVRAGGTLVRFAGAELAGHPSHTGDDPLLPVGLRAGGRSFGGALSWDKPAKLADFTSDSPFAGLTVPSDVTVGTQVLAEPSPDLDARTWARLQDGTPLVTGARLGEGWVVLIHTTANAEWTTLPLSGLFPAMLERLLHLAPGNSESLADAARQELSPLQILDGFGQLGEPSTLTPVATRAEISPQHPPGWYGRTSDRQAVNLASSALQPHTIAAPLGVTAHAYGEAASVTALNLAPYCLLVSLILLLVDGLLSLSLRGFLKVAGVILLAAALTHTEPVRADDIVMPEAALATRLAYVLTGNAEVDALTASGMRALSEVVSDRSAADLAPPVAIDLSHSPGGPDPLAFFPLIVWPAVAGQVLPDERTQARFAFYRSHGGMLVIDGRGRDNAAALRTLLTRLDIPALAPMTDDNVLTRSFYLLHGLPGRVEGGQIWLAAGAGKGAGGADEEGVSPLIIGANDWIGAWALDASERPRLPMENGGEQGREMAFRAGVNMVMVALTGSYKADQVHFKAILERLGR